MTQPPSRVGIDPGVQLLQLRPLETAGVSCNAMGQNRHSRNVVQRRERPSAVVSAVAFANEALDILHDVLQRRFVGPEEAGALLPEDFVAPVSGAGAGFESLYHLGHLKLDVGERPAFLRNDRTIVMRPKTTEGLAVRNIRAFYLGRRGLDDRVCRRNRLGHRGSGVVYTRKRHEHLTLVCFFSLLGLNVDNVETQCFITFAILAIIIFLFAEL